jgi:hypothetical protein
MSRRCCCCWRLHRSRGSVTCLSACLRAVSDDCDACVVAAPMRPITTSPPCCVYTVGISDVCERLLRRVARQGWRVVRALCASKLPHRGACLRSGCAVAAAHRRHVVGCTHNYSPMHVRICRSCCGLVLQTSEAERIGVNQVAKILPSGKSSGSDQRASGQICMGLQCLTF